MNSNTPSLDLMEFVETNILPQYAAFDRAHNLEHVTRVIRNALDLVRITGADANMVYIIAAYHDLAADARLKQWFSAEQKKIMREAVEDQRASASHTPRSLYGKIIAEADRDIVPEVVFKRAIEFGLANYPELDYEQQWQRFRQHMDEKYSANGYIRLWISGSPNERRLNELRSIIAQPAKLRQAFEQILPPPAL